MTILIPSTWILVTRSLKVLTELNTEHQRKYQPKTVARRPAQIVNGHARRGSSLPRAQYLA